MKSFFSAEIPDLRRFLFVESGPRPLLNGFLPRVDEIFGKPERVDVFTCFPGAPVGWSAERGALYRTADYGGASGRQRLVQQFGQQSYDVIVIICADVDIMTKWKWLLAARVPAKLFVLNENGDGFWGDYTNWRLIVEVAALRAGLSGANAVTTIGRALLFPFVLLYLIGFAVAVQTRRKLLSLVH